MTSSRPCPALRRRSRPTRPSVDERLVASESGYEIIDGRVVVADLAKARKLVRRGVWRVFALGVEPAWMLE